jgi:DNA-binding XRE family transcriptional regulator
VKPDLKNAIQLVNARRKKSLQQMIAKGKSPTDMAKALGVSRQRIHQMLAEFGLKETQV